MNLNRLKELEANFLEVYPKGFEDDRIQAIIKKHNTAKLGEQVREMFAKVNFTAPALICDNFAAVVAKSTMVSLFEKPKVQDMVKSMSSE